MKAWNSTFKAASKPMTRSPMRRSEKKAEISDSKRLKNKGMKGISSTASQRRFHERMASIGCIACRMDGVYQPLISIHHIDGRTKPDAHWKVLPLCAGHHQDGTGAPGLIAVHPWKTRFENKYGRQLDLLEMCREIIGEKEAA